MRTSNDGKKIATILFWNRSFGERGLSMRKSGRILLGSIVALALVSAPALAKSQKADDNSAAAACSAYEKAPDGSWTPVPCREIGPGGRKHQESKQPPSDDDADR